MRYDLARRLVNRKPDSPDINPDGLSLSDIEELDISAEDWQLLIDLESDGKRRPEVLTIAQEKMAVAKPEDEYVKPEDNQVEFNAAIIASGSLDHLRNLELTREQWSLVLAAELAGKNRIGAIEFIEAKLE